MSGDSFHWKDFHHSIYQWYHGFIALTLVPFALLFLGWDSDKQKVEVDYASIEFIAGVQLVWLIGFLSWYSWKGKMVALDDLEELDLGQKLKEFKKKNLVKYVFLTLGGLLAVLAMWLQPSFIFVLAYFAILIQFSLIRPSEDKMVRDLRLTKADRKYLHEHS